MRTKFVSYSYEKLLSEQRFIRIIFGSKGVFYVAGPALLYCAFRRTSYLVSSHHSRSEIAHAGRCAALK